VLGALRCVDHLVAFDADTPLDLLRALRPDVDIKGGDYRVETLPAAPLMAELHGQVVPLPYLKGRSTSGMLRRLRDGTAPT
jgi:D-beta-D-heptose 7-phosphate kinase / D-beta-D-heptose 1-phosphate adenosyltransferase